MIPTLRRLERLRSLVQKAFPTKLPSPHTREAVFIAVAVAELRGRATSPSQLCHDLGADKATISRTLRALMTQPNPLIMLMPDPTDARRRVILLTRAGYDLIRALQVAMDS